MADDLIALKVQQAIELMREFDIPAWLVQFAGETFDHPQPVQHLAVGTTVTWPSAFFLTSDGRKIAIVGSGDVANVGQVGAYDEVIGYVQDIGPVLRDVFQRLDPERVAVSFSLDDSSADNITHGMFLLLNDLLDGTPYVGRMIPADTILAPLRSRKLPIEVERIEAAIATTMSIFADIERLLNLDMTESELAGKIHSTIRERGLSTAWDPRYDPTVNFGPEVRMGHAGPGRTALERGMLVHIDLGIRQSEYCSDLQRLWYIPRLGEDRPPDEVMSAFQTLRCSLAAGFDALCPGVAGWQVDEAARTVLLDAGYDAPEFALGHQLGQSTHDGGALLGPRWPRYGGKPEMLVEEGNVFTLEYAVPSPAGIVALEEDVLVTAGGARYLGEPQTELRCLRL